MQLCSKWRVLGLVLVLGTLDLSSAFAQRQEISFNEILMSAIQQSPLAHSLQAELVAELSQAALLERHANPELSTEIRPPLSNSKATDIEYELSIAQPVSFAQFGARRSVAELIRRANSVEAKVSLVQFEKTLLLAYGKAWALSEKEQLTNDSLIRADRIAEKLNAAFKSGLIAQSTQKIFVAERKKLAVELKGVSGDRARAFADLTKKSGVVLKGKKLSPLRFEQLPTEISNTTVESLAVAERIKLASELSRAQEKLARLDAYPKFTPRIAFEHTNDGDDRINLGFSIDLPISDRNQAEIMRSLANKSAKESEADYLRDGRLQEELTLLLDSVRSSHEQARAFKAEVIPAVIEALSAAEQELNAGQGTNLQIWQLLSELTALQDRYLELWTKALSERVELSLLLGQDL